MTHGDPVSTTSTLDMAPTLRQPGPPDLWSPFTRHSAQHHARVIADPYRACVPEPTPVPAHQVSLTRTGRFMLPECSCGWIGTARVTVGVAREEARDHALLYADADISAEQIRVLVSFDPAEPDPGE